MRIYICEKMAFVEVGNGYMLCIGSKEKVDHSTDKEVVEMVEQALAYAKYQSITNTRRQAVN